MEADYNLPLFEYFFGYFSKNYKDGGKVMAPLLTELFTTFLVIEIKTAKAENALYTLEDLRKKISEQTQIDIAYVSPNGVLLKQPTTCSITSYASAIEGGKLSSEVLELINIKGPTILVMALTLSEKDAEIWDNTEKIDYYSFIAAAVVEAMEKKKDCAFLLTSNSTDYNNCFIEAMLSKFPSIVAERFSHTVYFRSQSGYDEGVMWARVKELLDYLSKAAAK